jgi:hypothetical protein
MLPIGMTRKEAQARLGIRDLAPAEIKELKELADTIYTEVLGPDWRHFSADRTKTRNVEKR